MRLELCTFPVADIVFGRRTSYDNGVLQVNKDQLLGMILSDKRITKADIDIVRPGEEARITWVRDVVEPRVKASGSGRVFPGIIGLPEPVGAGRTHRLSGIGVVASVGYTSTLKTGSGRAHPALFDMFGPAAPISVFASNSWFGKSHFDFSAAERSAETADCACSASARAARLSRP